MLSFEEFKNKYYTFNVDSEFARSMQRLHGVDIEAEMEETVKREYESYKTKNEPRKTDESTTDI